jgi:hypothetical protein
VPTFEDGFPRQNRCLLRIQQRKCSFQISSRPSLRFTSRFNAETTCVWQALFSSRNWSAEALSPEPETVNCTSCLATTSDLTKNHRVDAIHLLAIRPLRYQSRQSRSRKISLWDGKKPGISAPGDDPILTNCFRSGRVCRSGQHVPLPRHPFLPSYPSFGI